MRHGRGSPYIDLFTGISQRMRSLRREKVKEAGLQQETNHRPKMLRRKWLGSKTNTQMRRRKEIRNEL